MDAASLTLFATLLAQEGDEAAGSALFSYGILLLIPVAMYFLLIRPQRRRAKQQAEMQSSLGVGDEVITTSGMYGFITGEEGGLFWLEIDDDVQIRVAKAAIQGKVNTSGDKAAKPDTTNADDDATDDDA
ncbi:MAG TPA: preprotein translocase subunit YajC [Ilumatobacter sp.]|nr:preprotein translocase subunit YajC [Ilumatobacter sp.]